MKKLTLILNWLVIVCICLSTGLYFVAHCLSDETGTVGVIGGKDGPTAIFLSPETTPLTFVLPFLMAVLLLMNLYVIRKKHSFANQPSEPT